MRAIFLPALLLVLGAFLCLAVTDSASAQIIYSSSTFANPSSTNSATQYSFTADVLQGGSLAGTVSGSLTYGGGTNPFLAPNWNGGASLAIGGTAPNDDNSAVETADGVWSFVITPAAGYQVDGISLFTQGTSIANPTFAGLTSNGSATVIDANQGTATELFASHSSGAFANGSNLVFNTGSTSNGIPTGDHSLNWSFDSAGATSLSFDYQVGPVPNISGEGIRLDAQLSLAPVPEPSAIALMGLMGSLAFLRRRK